MLGDDLPVRAVVGQATVKVSRRHSKGYFGRVYVDKLVRYDLSCGHQVTLLRKAHGKGGGNVRDPVSLACPVCGPGAT